MSLVLASLLLSATADVGRCETQAACPSNKEIESALFDYLAQTDDDTSVIIIERPPRNVRNVYCATRNDGGAQCEFTVDWSGGEWDYIANFQNDGTYWNIKSAMCVGKPASNVNRRT